jgi:hypothetical protein
MTWRPISRLGSVRDANTGLRVDSGAERAEYLLDEDGCALSWRVWCAGPDRSWHSDEWRPPTEQMMARWRAWSAARANAGSPGGAA